MTRKRRALNFVGETAEMEAAPPSGRRGNAARAARGPAAGRLAGVTADGRLLVTWGEPAGPAVAAWIATGASSRALLDAVETRAPVLLDFLEGDGERPVILALLRERLDVDAEDAAQAIAVEPRIELRAGEDLSLTCGESEIHLRQDGRVTIRGTHVESLSTGAVRIKGASVGIN
jgi:Domain of unknown function (DUF6484)